MAVIDDLRSYLANLRAPDVDALHRNADTDTSRRALHHTLGPKGNQAAPGNHIHDGNDSSALVPASIPNLPASKITSGTLADARIPNLDAGKITSGVFDSARIPLQMNNVLWTGGIFMQDGQSAPLSQRISDQQTGIIMVWSAYANGASQNYNWHFTFVPKYHVISSAGAGVSDGWSRGADSAAVLVSKYVYVTDTVLNGNANNSVSPNNNIVLRAVLGV